MWLYEHDCKIIVVEQKELKGTESSDHNDASLT